MNLSVAFLVQEHSLIRLLSSIHKLVPSVLGGLSLPDGGQCDIISSHDASYDRVWKPQPGKCEQSVSRNLTVHDIYNKLKVKCPFFFFFSPETTCFTISEAVAKSENVQKVGNEGKFIMVNMQYNTMDRVKEKKKRNFLHHCSSNV